MPYPNFPKKHLQTPFFSPQDFVGFSRDYKKITPGQFPEKFIILYQKSLIEYLKKNFKLKQLTFTFYSFDYSGTRLGIYAVNGIGAPSAVTFLEEAIALGAREFINLGASGGLQEILQIGDIVVCNRAIRDEGTSYHYLESEKYSHSSTKITQKIHNYFLNNQIPFQLGTTWTTDAPYRETVAEISQYRNEGVLTVEMEAAALFAVAQVRQVEMGALFTISDTLSGEKWIPQFHSAKVKDGLIKTLNAAIEIFSEF